MEKKGLRVNIGKTKIMESGINLDVLKKSGKYPVVSVSQELVALMQSSVVAASAGCVRNTVALKDPCTLTLGTARAIDEREVSEVEVGNEKLEVVPEFCYLGDMLSAGAGCDHTLQMCMGQVSPIASPSHQPPSDPSDQR